MKVYRVLVAQLDVVRQTAMAQIGWFDHMAAVLVEGDVRNGNRCVEAKRILARAHEDLSILRRRIVEDG
jgi:hypothetical protein